MKYLKYKTFLKFFLFTRRGLHRFLRSSLWYVGIDWIYPDQTAKAVSCGRTDQTKGGEGWNSNGDGVAEFQSSEIMIDGFLEMLMGKIQEVLICRLIMIDLDMGNGKDLYFFVCFFFAGTIQCHNGALHGLRGTREMHRSNLPKGVSSLPVSHIFTMFTSESSLLDESLAETSKKEMCGTIMNRFLAWIWPNKKAEQQKFGVFENPWSSWSVRLFQSTAVQNDGSRAD